MTAPTTEPPIRPVAEAEAGEVFLALRTAMEEAGFPSRGMYREVQPTHRGDVSVYVLGSVTMSGAKRLTAILRAARRPQ
ncbi:hypothetical protein ABZ567_31125 [Streptomyces sp. NPDC016459]|uniref:hypothetical protein n=1 Tax=Streptomyces sp. NPDC016459 TaxID=3157190 RepID=UPI00340A7DD8